MYRVYDFNNGSYALSRKHPADAWSTASQIADRSASVQVALAATTVQASAQP